jgi:anti-sigma factor RsiW
MGFQKLGRPFDKHIDGNELNALVSSSETARKLHGLSPDAAREAERHVESCADCRRKVSQYRRLVNLSSNATAAEGAPRGADCPRDEDVDWHEVAAGLWPELKAKQLILHAALCDHCGPLLRAAAAVNDDPTPQEEELLAQLKAPSRPVAMFNPETIPPDSRSRPAWRQFLRWKILVPTVALLAIAAVFSTRPPSSAKPLSGPEYAKFAVNTHQQFAQGSLALDLRSDSQQGLNEWLKTQSPFSLALPVSPPGTGEERPYRLEGARLVRVAGKTAAFIAYQMQTGPVSLMVTPDSVAVASGGVEVDFKSLSFHYGMVEGYKVVTWSVHGLTYALVSQEGNKTQRSCMVCHSAMGDRDLSHTPTPLSVERSALAPLFQ